MFGASKRAYAACPTPRSPVVALSSSRVLLNRRTRVASLSPTRSVVKMLNENTAQKKICAEGAVRYIKRRTRARRDAPNRQQETPAQRLGCNGSVQQLNAGRR